MEKPDGACDDQSAYAVLVRHVFSKVTDELCRDRPSDGLCRDISAKELPEDVDSFYVDGRRRLLDIDKRHIRMDAR